MSTSFSQIEFKQHFSFKFVKTATSFCTLFLQIFMALLKFLKWGRKSFSTGLLTRFYETIRKRQLLRTINHILREFLT